MPTTTEVLATLALAPTSGDGASRGLPPTKRGQAALFANLPEGPAAADCQQPGGTAELIDEPAAMPMTTEVLATLTLVPTSGDGASRGLPPRKGGQAALFANLPEGPAAADCQQPGGTAELIDELAAMPTTTEVLATLALAPTSGDGASRGLPPTKKGQAVGLPEEAAALVLFAHSFVLSPNWLQRMVPVVSR